MYLAARDTRGGFLPLLVTVSNEDFAPGMGLFTGKVLEAGPGGGRLEKTHAGLGCGTRAGLSGFLCTAAIARFGYRRGGSRRLSRREHGAATCL
jgi:hypothetical protein